MPGGVDPLTNEHALRMGHALLLNAAVLASAYHFLRRRGSADALQRLLDTLLLWLSVQYVSVALCGIAGVLDVWTMTSAALLACVVMWLAARNGQSLETPSTSNVAWEWYAAWACGGFLLGYAGAVIVNQYYVPVMSDDALTYHVPAAVRWLQTGRLVLHEVWFFNPANTYSPLAGSTFIAWWLAPLGNDWLARFVQVPGLVLIFVGMIRLGRLLGAPLALAALVALAAVSAKPFMRQILVTKDDLYLAGFFLAAVIALAQENLLDRLGPWRLGAAVGLFLATKYTALLALPVLLLMADAPWRAGWNGRRWAIAILMAGVIAGPWFLRNWWMMGNPLFPIDVGGSEGWLFRGLFATRRSEELRTFSGVWRVLGETHFRMPPTLLIVLAATCAAVIGMLLLRRSSVKEPLPRVCAFGPSIGFAVFVLTSPYAEVRFLGPVFLLLFGCVAFVLASLPRMPSVALAVGLAVVSVYASFVVNRGVLFQGGIIAMVVAAALAFILDRMRLGARGVAGMAAVCVLAVASYVFVYQDINIARYIAQTHPRWADPTVYGPLADAWEFVRTSVPRDATVAYTNTNLVYPLMGFVGDRRVVYAPTRPDVTTLHSLPHLPGPVSGEHLVAEVARVTTADADVETWIANLRRLNADYLFVARDAVVKDPPELTFARGDRARFEPVFENAAATVYRIRWYGK